MKNFKFIILLTLITVIFSCTSENKGYIIDGNIKAVDGTIYLSVLEGKQPVVIDSTEAIDGIFKFKGTVATPAMATLSVKGENSPFAMFFIENSAITIVGDKNNKQSIIVNGSSEQDLYQTGFVNSNEDDTKIIEFIKNNPSSIAAAYTLFRNMSYKLPADQLTLLAEGFDDNIKNSSYIKILYKRIEAMKNSEVGKPYMEIALPDTAGNIVSLSSVIKEGKYVLLDFWASWCPPCRAENPNVAAAYNKYKDKGFTVYGVSLDRPNGKEAWSAAIVKDGLDWYNVSDLKFWESEPASLYGVNSIPSNFLISPEGKIIGKNLRGAELESTLENIFKPLN